VELAGSSLKVRLLPAGLAIHYNRRVFVQVDAVYENGVLRPLQPLDLTEHEHVVISVARTSPALGRSALAVEYVENLRKEMQNAGPAPGLEAVRQRLTRISGSMADEIIAARGDH
jgi:predicted DNA-binding antitoxin AbrB/MazE fold protein